MGERTHSRAALWIFIAALAIGITALFVSGVSAAPGNAGDDYECEDGTDHFFNDAVVGIPSTQDTTTTSMVYDDCYQIKIIKIVEGMEKPEPITLTPTRGMVFHFSYYCTSDNGAITLRDGDDNGGIRGHVKVLVEDGMGMSDYIDVGHYGDCTVREMFPDGDGHMWQTEPASREMTYELGPDTGSVMEFVFVNRPMPRPTIKIVKKVTSMQGEPGLSFYFDYQCWSEDRDTFGGGDDDYIEVYVNEDGMGMSRPIDVYGYDECTVWEVFPDGGGELWITEPRSREITKPVGGPIVRLADDGNGPPDRGPTVFRFVNTPRPLPQDGHIWVNKVFKGTQDWDFDFHLTCRGPERGFEKWFSLGGGDDIHFDIPFRPVRPLPDSLLFGENERPWLECWLYEEALPGDWEVSIDVDGSQYEINGSGVGFHVYPGSEVDITYINKPGYLPGKPTGFPKDQL